MKPHGPKLKIKNQKVFYVVAHIGIPILTALNLLNILAPVYRRLKVKINLFLLWES